jgi:hypothetical protein
MLINALKSKLIAHGLIASMQFQPAHSAKFSKQPPQLSADASPIT